MINLTLTNQDLAADAYFYSNCAAQVRITGADASNGLRLYIVSAAGVVVAYADEFEGGVGEIQLNTTAMQTVLAQAAYGRKYMFAAVLADASGNTLGTGFVRIVAAPSASPPIDIGVETVEKVKALLQAESTAEEPDTQQELWERHRQLAGKIVEVL